MQCRSCSREIPEETHFCGFCGARFDSDVSRTVTYLVPSPTPHPSTRNEGRFPFGTVLVGRYRILNLAGRGGMGEVYRALDLKLDEVVALKFLPEAKAGLPDLESRLLAELRIARQITHPNICRLYDVGEVDGQPFISMEYVDGEDLGSLLRRKAGTRKLNRSTNVHWRFGKRHLVPMIRASRPF